MNVTPAGLAGVLVIEPTVHDDARGFFMESWSRDRYASHGIGPYFAQDNFALCSSFGVLRGMHAQRPHDQGKLISVWQGAVWSAVVDIRLGSPQFGRWCGVRLSASNKRQLWVPPGYAHGCVALAHNTLLHYKCTQPYVAEAAIGFRWNDPTVGIAWPVTQPILSERDANAPSLSAIAA